MSNNISLENTYSYLEFCNIPADVKQLLDKKLEFETYMNFCINEELSVSWLTTFFNLSAIQSNKLIFIEIAADEYKHSLLYADLVKHKFSEKNFQESYIAYKELILKRDFLNKLLDPQHMNFSIFCHFMDENQFTVDLKYQYLNCKDSYTREILKTIFAEESKHVALGKKIKLDVDQDFLDKCKKTLLIEMKQILIKRMRYLDSQLYIREMNLIGYNLNDFLHNIKKSQKSKDITVGSIDSLYNYGKSFGCINDPTLEDFLTKNNIIKKYEELYE